ncbi:MAG TPA: ketopantoate reductase family protein [Microbacteriaceae bacterium]|nr:ketopantoate reductase family protein [Microbacteriaceae bacterium]
MRIGVIGAGAMGGLLAARLSDAGHAVQVVARGTHRDAIAENGLRLRGAFGEVTCRPRVVDALDSVELVLVCVKLHDSEAALRAHAAGIGTAPVVLIQNGVEGFALARSILPQAPLFGGISLIAANFTEPGLVTVTNPGPVLVGRGYGPADAETEAIAGVLADAVPARAIANFEGATWTKLVFNMANAIPAITGLSVQQVGAHPWLARVPAAAMREAARVGLARGVQFGKLEGISPDVITSIAEQPARETVPFVRASAGDMGDTPNLASMLQSVRRGRPTEVDFLNGAVVRFGSERGVPTPVNAVLTKMVHRVERTGRAFAPNRLRVALWRSGVWL